MSNYLGRPWVPGEYDCWALVREIYEQELSIVLPTVTVDAANVRAVLNEIASTPVRGLFDPVPEPQHLAVVEMRQCGHPSHVGVYLETSDGPRILHNRRGAGVVCEEPRWTGFEHRYYVPRRTLSESA